MDVDEEERPQNEAEKMRDFRRRFFDFLWNHAVVVDPETSQATSADASNRNQEQTINPYRCAPPSAHMMRQPAQQSVTFSLCLSLLMLAKQAWCPAVRSTGRLPCEVKFKLKRACWHLCREQVQSMAEAAYQDTLFVRLSDVKWYDPDLADHIQLTWLRLEPYLCQAVQKLVRELMPEFVKDQDGRDREFSIAWEGVERIERLRDLRSAAVRLRSSCRLSAPVARWGCCDRCAALHRVVAACKPARSADCAAHADGAPCAPCCAHTRGAAAYACLQTA